MTFYKLRHKETGLFSRGGTTPRFSKKGKTWNQIGHVRCHLAQFRGRYGYGATFFPDYPASVEIVEYNVGGETTERVISAS